jgi:hypothetical protein
MDRLEKNIEYQGTVLDCKKYEFVSITNSSMSNPLYRFIIELVDSGTICVLFSAANASYCYGIDNSVIAKKVVFTVNGWNKIDTLSVV